MTGLFYSPTTQQILTIFCDQPGETFHVNELIRLTGRYPNSVQHALKGLEKHKLVTSSRSGRLKLYQINSTHPIYPELRSIFSKLFSFVEQKLLPLEERPIEWLKILNRPSHMALMYANYEAYQKPMTRYVPFSFQYGWHNGVTGGIYIAKKEIISLNNLLSQKVNKDRSFAENLLTQYQDSIDKLLEVTKKTPPSNQLQKQQNQILAQQLKKFLRQYYRWLPFLIIHTSLEIVLERQIDEELERKLKQVGEENLKIEYIRMLKTTVEEIPECHDALELAQLVKENGWSREAKKKLEEHTKKYCWLPMWYLKEKPLRESYFKEEIDTIISTTSNITQELTSIVEQKKERNKQIEKTIKRLKLSKKWRKSLKLLHKLIILRTRRKHSIAEAHYHHLSFLKEIAKRLNLSFKELLLLTYEEMVKVLEGEKIPSNTVLSKRKQGFAVLLWEGKVKIISGKKAIIETMERFRIVSCGDEEQILKPLSYSSTTNKPTLAGARDTKQQLTGRPAFPGITAGIVKVIRTQEDLKKIKEGDIIVTRQAEPSYLSCLYKASGLIVDEPDTSSHAVLYAQSLKLPTIIGTNIGTQILKDNEKVRLDANQGIVKRNSE